MIKYPSIEQFRGVVKAISHDYEDGERPTLQFTGTVKVHGTNAGVLIRADGTQKPQSRSRELTIENDNFGFAAWHSQNQDFFTWYRDKLLEGGYIFDTDDIVIFGEWAGGNIQQGVAVCGVDKFFYIFGICTLRDEEIHQWLEDYPLPKETPSIIFAEEPVYYVTSIDFNKPEESLQLLSNLTDGVEASCPVGKYLGVEGIGEGIVWSFIDEKGGRVAFKVKGDKHSTHAGKRSAMLPTPNYGKINDFVDSVLTEARLEQGFLEACNREPDVRLIGTFIKWVVADVLKEESDVIAESELNVNKVKGTLGKKAASWFKRRAL